MQVDKHILIRYFLGQSSEDEKETIRKWLESDDANKKHFVRERIRFDASIVANEEEVTTNKRFRMNSVLRKSLQIAATILLLIGSIFMYDTYKMEKLSQTFQCIRVPAGNRTHITLPDGTEVWLNANTSLRYPIAFSEQSREVMLDGEAYFDVTKDRKPFIVKTDKYDVEVLGTIFNVEAYASEPNFRTVLYEGKVKLFNTRHPEAIFLASGQTAQLIGDALQVSSTTDVNSYRWKDGLIYIEDKSFSAIMELFEKFYDVRIVVSNHAVKELGYHGKLRISDGVDHALRVLQNDFPFVYERDEENNIIYINE